MPRLSSSLISFDLFGLRPKLFFQGKAHSGTRFGIFLTCLFISLVVLCFFYFGQDLYFRKNPTIIYNEQYESSPEKFVLDPEIMPILVEINSPYADEFYTDRSIVEARVSQLTINKTLPETVVTSEEYEMEICTPAHLAKTDEKTRTHFLTFNLKDYFCIPRNIKNLTAQGAFDQPVYQAIKIAFHMCNNLTYFNKCKSAEAIQNKLNRGFIGYYFKDLTIDPGNYEDPKIPAPKQVFTNFVLNSQKELDIFIKNNYVETDDGPIMPQEQTEKIINYDSYLEFNFMQENSEFLMVYMRLAQKRAIYKRRYSKIQNLVAQVGGFINMFWLILLGINFFHSNLLFIRDIVHDIFNINFIKLDTFRSINTYKLAKIGPKLIYSNTEDDKGGSKDELFKKIGKFGGGNEGEGGGTEGEGGKTSKKITINDMENLIKTNGTVDEENDIVNLELGLWDFINYYFGIMGNPERNQKKALIKKGMDILQKNLDVKNLIQKFYEIEKLKVLLLDEDQLRLFDSLPKPELELIVKRNQFDVITRVLKRRVSGEKDVRIRKKSFKGN